MARGQETQRTGGELSPYVQSSLQGNRQAASNRLIAAMQQASAGQRQSEAIASQEKIAGQQMQAQQTAQAADAAMQDKRAAEAEAARREDMKFSEMQNRLNREAQAEQERLRRDFLTAQSAEDWKRTKELRQEQMDADNLLYRDMLAANERTVNAIVSMTKGMANNQTAAQKAITLADDALSKEKMTMDTYNARKDTIKKGIKRDKSMDLPVIPEFERSSRPVEFTKIMANLTTGLLDPRQIIRMDKELRVENKAFAQSVRPKDVLQAQINKNQSKINILDLMPDHTQNFTKKIADNKISAEDITIAWAGLKSYGEVIDEKLDDAKEGSPEERFWEKERSDADLMENSIKQSIFDTTKINDTETVGARVRAAIGKIEGFSSESVLAQKQRLMREAGVQDPMALYNELTKGIEPYKLYEIDPKDSPYTKRIKESRNAVILEFNPKLEVGGGQ